MLQLFKDINHHNSFQRNGYLVLSSLSEQAIDDIAGFFHKQDIVNNNDCFASNIVLSQEQNKKISERLVDFAETNINDIFIHHEFVGGNFLIKRKEHGELHIHQDNTLVDDTSDDAYFLWIPFTDVDQKNGCMFVIPGSHKFPKNYVSYSLKSPDVDRRKLPEAFVRKIEMKKGDVLIFSYKLLHGSYKNDTDTKRVAVNILVTNKGAQLLYYNKRDDHSISEYHITKEAFLNSYESYSKGHLPTGAIHQKDIMYSHVKIDHKYIYKQITHKNYPVYLEAYNYLSSRYWAIHNSFHT